MVSMSLMGSTSPSTWVMSPSTKQRTTWAMASHSRILARNWLPRPSPLEAPRTSPAMSTKVRRVGMISFDPGDLGQHFKARIGHGDVADIGLDGAEGIVRRLRRRRLRQGVEQGRFADVGQAHDAAFETHGPTLALVKGWPALCGAAAEKASPLQSTNSLISVTPEPGSAARRRFMTRFFMSPRIIPLLVVIGLGFSAAPVGGGAMPERAILPRLEKNLRSQGGRGQARHLSRRRRRKENRQGGGCQGGGACKGEGDWPGESAREGRRAEARAGDDGGSPAGIAGRRDAASGRGAPPAKAELAPPVAHMPAFSPYGALR